MGAHATLSASGAHRWGLSYSGPSVAADPDAWLDPKNWQGCSGSVALEAGFPDTGSRFAAEGTAAHELASACLTYDHNAEQYRDSEITVDETEDGGDVYVFTVDDEMIDGVQRYVDYVRAIPGEHYVEQRLDYSTWVPGGFGTGDSIVLSDGELFVTDLKFGKGLAVSTECNPQLLLYGLGALAGFGDGVDIVTMSIVQPRIFANPSEWSVTRDQLLQWAETVLRDAALRVETHPGEYNPGEKRCQFCKGAGVCRALATQSVAVAAQGFDAVAGPTADVVVTDGPPALDGDEIGALLPYVPLIEKWIAEIKSHAKSRLERGEPVAGRKLVQGNNQRSWLDEGKAANALKRALGTDVAMPRKLLSPPQAEKLLGEDHKILTKHVRKEPGNPIMVADTDTREAIVVDVTEGFEAIPAAE